MQHLYAQTIEFQTGYVRNSEASILKYLSALRVGTEKVNNFCTIHVYI